MVLRHSKLITVLLTFVTASPVAGVALWSIHRTFVELSDPCAKWEDTSGDRMMAMTAVIGPHDVCRTLSIHSGSKRSAVIMAAFVPGGMLAAAILAVGGAAFSRRRVVLAGAFGMLLETIVAFTIAPLTLVVGLALLVLARRVQSDSGVVAV